MKIMQDESNQVKVSANMLENFGIKELPETVEDCLEDIGVLRAEIAEITERLELEGKINRDLNPDIYKWARKAIGARSIKRKQIAVLEGQLHWLKKDEKRENIELSNTKDRKCAFAMKDYLRENNPDVYAAVIEMLKNMEDE